MRRYIRSTRNELKKNNALDFDDLIVKDSGTISRITVRSWNIIRNGFKYIMVDEYQDTNTGPV
ncbi:MAG: UvrD-helicase domain-containing protein [Enterocloster sp.]